MGNNLLTKITPTVFTIKQNTALNNQIKEAVIAQPLNNIFIRPNVNFSKALLKPVHILPFLFRREGPVLSDGSSVLDDRYSVSLKWYLPEFTLKDPLNGGYTFTCKRDGKTSDNTGNIVDNYTGAITMGLNKSIPQQVSEMQTANPGFVFYEVALNDLVISLSFQLANKTPLIYPATIVVTGEECSLTINADDLGVLSNLYKILSDPTSMPFCSLRIQASYFAYRQKYNPLDFRKFRFNPAFSRSKERAVLNKGSVGQEVQEKIKISNRFNLIGKLNLNNFRKIVPRFSTVDSVAHNVVPLNSGVQNAVLQNEVKEKQFVADEAVAFLHNITPVNFDCATYPNNYQTITDTGEAIAFGCNPPFDSSIQRKHVYAKFPIINGSLSDASYGVNRIYRNQQTNGYLVIPERYVIVLEDPTGGGTLVPSAYLSTTIDINDANGLNNSSATYKFRIAPSLTARQAWMIKQLILKNLPLTLQKTIEEIHLEFPKSINTELDGHLFNGYNIPDVEFVNLGADVKLQQVYDVFQLDFKQVPIHDGTAGTLAIALKSAGGMADTLYWLIDSDDAIMPQSAVVLSLQSVTGNGLQLSKDPSTDHIYLVNCTLYDIVLTNFDDYKPNNSTPDDDTPDDGILDAGNTNITIAGNTFLNLTTQYPNKSLSSIDTLNYDYKVNLDYINQVIKELRFNADQVDDDIIVTNNTGLFATYGITAIEFFISIIKPGETDPAQALITAQKTIMQDGVINHVPFVLPVTAYLSKWSAVYYTVISFANGTSNATNPVLIDDLNSVGKIINLTITNLELN
jgi:hypothetical protein